MCTFYPFHFFFETFSFVKYFVRVWIFANVSIPVQHRNTVRLSIRYIIILLDVRIRRRKQKTNVNKIKRFIRAQINRFDLK